MGWRFHKRIKFLGIWVNIGKHGVTSVSAGKRGFTTNCNFKKGVTSTASIPSTGISYQHKWGGKAKKPTGRKAVAFWAKAEREWTAVEREWAPIEARLSANDWKNDDIDARELAIAWSRRSIALCDKYGGDAAPFYKRLEFSQQAIERIKARQAADAEWQRLDVECNQLRSEFARTHLDRPRHLEVMKAMAQNSREKVLFCERHGRTERVEMYKEWAARWEKNAREYEEKCKEWDRIDREYEEAQKRPWEPSSLNDEGIDKQVAEKGFDDVIGLLSRFANVLAARIENGELDQLEPHLKQDKINLLSQVRAKVAELTKRAALLDKPVTKALPSKPRQ